MLDLSNRHVLGSCCNKLRELLSRVVSVKCWHVWMFKLRCCVIFRRGRSQLLGLQLWNVPTHDDIIKLREVYFWYVLVIWCFALHRLCCWQLPTHGCIIGLWPLLVGNLHRYERSDSLFELRGRYLLFVGIFGMYELL